MNARACLVALGLVLVATATANHAPPAFTIQSSTAWTGADFSTSIGTLQGVATDGTNYYVSATAALARYDASGNQAWLKDTSGDGQGGAAQTDLTYHAGKLYVGHKSASGQGLVGIYSASTGAFQNEVTLGTGTPSAITYAHGSFWVVWTTGDTTYEIQQRDDALNLVASYPLGAYPADTGPQGAAWIDWALLLPRHAASGDPNGIDVYRFHPTHATPSFEYVHTMPYVAWTTSAGRNEVSSQGIDTVRDHERWSIAVVGRDAATGNGGGTGGVRHVALTLDRGQSYDSALLTIGAPNQRFQVTTGTLQGVASDDQGVVVSTTDALLRLDTSGTVTASRDTSQDGAATQNGDLTILDGRVYVHTSDYPANPRQAYIATYNTSTLAFIEERPIGNHDGAGGGVAAWNGSLWVPLNRNLGGDLAFRQIDPATLTVTQDHDLGHYGSISPQGIVILNGTAFVPQGNVDSLDSRDGWLIFTWTGTTWTFHGTLAYPTWTGSDGLTRYASQGIDFDEAADCTTTAWTVGRFYDGHGHGGGEVAHHPVNLGTLDVCLNDPPGEDPPGQDPPGGGSVEESASAWPLVILGVAALGVVSLAAWRFRSTTPAPDAPSTRALLLAAAVCLILVAAALAVWPYLPLPEAWT